MSRPSATATYSDVVKDAYSPAKVKTIRSQSLLDLQAIVSSHRACQATAAADEVFNRGRYDRLNDDDAERARRKNVAGDIWTAHTTGTFYKPLGNRRYCTRYDDGKDKDYFDWDLNHAVNCVKEERGVSGRFTSPSRGPSFWEHKLLKDTTLLHGQKMISPYLFASADDSTPSPKRTSPAMLSAMLTTPSYWTLRYERM